MSNIQDILDERQKTHGDFQANAVIMQDLKNRLVDSKNWPHLPHSQCEALQMIMHKVGRILEGNYMEPDHWRDIAGYATLVENILTTKKDIFNIHLKGETRYNSTPESVICKVTKSPKYFEPKKKLTTNLI